MRSLSAPSCCSGLTNWRAMRAASTTPAATDSAASATSIARSPGLLGMKSLSGATTASRTLFWPIVLSRNWPYQVWLPLW